MWIQIEWAQKRKGMINDDYNTSCTEHNESGTHRELRRIRTNELRGSALARDQRGQVLATVRYAGVNPIDWKIREGYMKHVFMVSFPLILGQDFGGEIVN